MTHLKALREALMPFAKEADAWNGYADDSGTTLQSPLLVRDFRRAKEALALTVPGETGDNTATDEPLVQPGAVVRHRKGGVYIVVGLGRLEATWEECVIYRAQDGAMIARSLAEFIDGRFIALKEAKHD